MKIFSSAIVAGILAFIVGVLYCSAILMISGLFSIVTGVLWSRLKNKRAKDSSSDFSEAEQLYLKELDSRLVDDLNKKIDTESNKTGDNCLMKDKISKNRPKYVISSVYSKVKDDGAEKMDFIQAMDAVFEGKKVKASYMEEGAYIYFDDYHGEICINNYEGIHSLELDREIVNAKFGIVEV
jgi:hypothetical protein